MSQKLSGKVALVTGGTSRETAPLRHPLEQRRDSDVREK